MATATDSLAARLGILRERHPHAYPRDYAAMLGTTEAELTPVFYPERALDLYDLEAALTSLAKLRRIKLMARTGFAVFELFTQVDFYREGPALVLSSGNCFVALNPHALGRLFFLSPASGKDKAAFLLFDRAGAAALKLYIEPREFDASLLKSAAGEPKEAADVASLLAAARAHSTPVTLATPRALIENAAVENKSLGFELCTEAVAVYIRHKPAKLADARGWFNILDEDFNLHLREEAIQTIETGAAMRLTDATGETVTIWRIS